MNIIKIESREKENSAVRVAAYVRVSTLQEGQKNSLIAQKEHFLSVIEKYRESENWQYAGIFYDEGITGTKKEIRPGLKQMLKACEDGKIDLILTKSISRFARNTTDCLEMVRKLMDLNVNIFFEKENIDTRKMENEFILTILSSLAEEESHSISANETWRFQKQFEDGTYRFRRVSYGYQLKDGEFVIDTEKAEILQWIFDQILSGKSCYQTAKELNQRKIPSPGNQKWSSRTIRALIQNPSCKGDVLFQKTWKDHSFRVHPNHGEYPMYYMENHHPAIIDAETWNMANDLLKKKKDASPVQHYCFTGKLRCGSCGSSLVRMTGVVKNRKRIYWGCLKHVENKEKCPLVRVSEESVQNAFVTMLNKLHYASELLFDPDICVLRQEHLLQETLFQIRQNTEKRNRLVLHRNSGCGQTVSFQQELILLEQESCRLRQKAYYLQNTCEEENRHFLALIHENTEHSFSDDVFRTCVHHVIVHPDHAFQFCLFNGMNFTERG